MRPGPASWFPGADGTPVGFDHDLLVRFAREQNLPLRVVIVESAAALLAQIAAGKVHIGAGGLFQGAPAKDDGAGAGDSPPQVLWSGGTHAVEPVLIYNRDGFRPKSFADLEGATVAYPEATGLDAQLAAARLAHPEVVWKAVDVPSSDALIAQVADGTINYAVVPSNDAAVAQNAYLDFAVAFPAGPRRLLAWAVSPSQKALRDAIDMFLKRLRGDGTLGRYAERYFEPVQRVERIDGEVFRERIRTLLPTYRRDFEAAQASTGIDWRLLAAVAYQESQWDPFATSETGVRGLMQLTEETARHLKVADRLDARASIVGAGALSARPEGEASRPHLGARPHVARTRRVQHRRRAPRGRARPRAEAEAQSRPVERRAQDAAAARAARVLRRRQVRLRARRHAGRVRRPRARLLRHPVARRAALHAAAAAHRRTPRREPR